jgi:type IV pilus assembly protein PilM
VVRVIAERTHQELVRARRKDPVEERAKRNWHNYHCGAGDDGKMGKTMAFDFGKLTAAFHAKPKVAVIGLDIGTSAIKVVQLNHTRGVPTLETYGELQLGPYDNADIGRTTNLTVVKLIEALVDILRESSVSATQVALAQSYSSSFNTIISIPRVDPDQVGASLPIEAKKYVPVPLNEVELSWLPAAPSADPKYMNILLMASHVDAMNRYQSVLSGASLTPVVRETEILSLIRSVLTPEDTRSVIIDLGAQSTRLFAVASGLPTFTHSVLLSGAGVTKAIAKNRNCSFKEAEELKRQVGLAGLPEVPELQKVIVGEYERGLRELHKALVRHEEGGAEPAERIILTGSGALTYGLRGYIEEMFMRPTVVADPFAKVAYPAFLEDTLKEAGPAFAGAIGAGLAAMVSE